MAPKKPPPPPPPPPPPEELIHVPKFKAIPPEVKWRVIRLFGIFCFGVFIASTVQYIKLLGQPPSPFIPPMETLRSTYASALRKPSLSGVSGKATLGILHTVLVATIFKKKDVETLERVQRRATQRIRGLEAETYEERWQELDLETAEEVIQLPNYQEESQKAYAEKKIKYQSIYKKGTVKTTTHWTLFGKNLYYISIGRKTWYDAQNFCLSRDSHMVSILNDEEQKFISSQFNDSVWIGLSDDNEEGTWQWSDGSRLKLQFWDAGSPTILKKNGEMERDCAFMNPSAGILNWRDDNCHALKQWACKEIIVMEDIEYLSQP